MATIEELDKRLSRIEQQSAVKFFIQYLLSPILILLAGTYINWRIDKAKSETQKIDLAQKMITYLFAGNPTQAFFTEKLMSKILEPDLANELEFMVVNYYKNKVEENIKTGDVENAEQIVSAAKEIGGDAAGKVLNSVKQDNAGFQRIQEYKTKKETALRLEREGYESLAREDYEHAEQSFKAAEREYPNFHSVYELGRLIEQNKEKLNNPEARKEVIKRITTQYSGYAPPEVVDKLKRNIDRK